MLKEQFKQTSGITIVVLIITIILMIILITISVKVVTDGEIFYNAENQVTKTNNKVTQEQQVVNTLMNEWNSIDSYQNEF